MPPAGWEKSPERGGLAVKRGLLNKAIQISKHRRRFNVRRLYVHCSVRKVLEDTALEVKLRREPAMSSGSLLLLAVD